MQTFLTTTLITAGIGALVNSILGFIWYGPIFGKAYGEIVGIPAASQMTEEENKTFGNKMIPLYITNFVLAFISFFALAYFAIFIGRLNIVGALTYAGFIWFGFIMPIEAGNALWSGKPKKLAWRLFFLTAGFQLISFLAAAAIWALIYPYFF